MAGNGAERLRALVEKSVSLEGGYLSVAFLADGGQERMLGRQPIGPVDASMAWIDSLMTEHGPGRFRVRTWRTGGSPTGSVVVQAEPDASEKPSEQDPVIDRPEAPPPPDPRLRVLEEQLRALQARYQDVSQRYERQTQEFQRYAGKIEGERDEARRLYQGEANQRHALQQERQLAQRRISELEGEKAALSQRLEASARLAGNQRGDEDRLRGEVRALQTENQHLQAEIQSLRADIANREEQRRRTDLRLQNLRRRSRELQESNNHYLQRDIDYINSFAAEEDG